METQAGYDALMGKSREAIIRELEQIIGAARITLAEAGQWLLGQRTPYGPIMRERDVSYLYKCVWGLYAARFENHYITEMLDWLYGNALRENGDFFFPEEPGDHQIETRAYRALTFLKFAALMDHPMIHDERILKRIRRYQDPATGGCFHYIGEDPDHPHWPNFVDVGNSAFFGEFGLAAGLKEETLKAGSWMLKVVEHNRRHMREEGTFYCQADRRGELITDVGMGEKIFKTVNNWDANQMGWNLGCAMALLADLYDAMQGEWRVPAAEARPYLDAAKAVANFEETMPLTTYYYPSKCKVAWGAARLLDVLLRYKLGDDAWFDKLYRICKRTFTVTFLGTQLPDGSWPAVHYPLSDEAPELRFDYRVLKGLRLPPNEKIPGSKTCSYLPATEITGEFMGEIGAMLDAMVRLLDYYRCGPYQSNSDSAGVPNPT